MEGVEFYIINSQTCISRDGVSQPLTQADRDVIEFMMEQLTKYYPYAVARLRDWASESEKNKWFYEFRIVDRFIRCNFGEADFLRPDVDDLGMFQFEEVKCPLRGICEDEGVICKPEMYTGLTPEEQRVAKLYAKGMLPGEIAKRLGKAEKTCKVQLWKACRRLHLPHPRWLIRLFSIYNIV